MRSWQVKGTEPRSVSKRLQSADGSQRRDLYVPPPRTDELQTGELVLSLAESSLLSSSMKPWTSLPSPTLFSTSDRISTGSDDQDIMVVIL